MKFCSVKKLFKRFFKNFSKCSSSSKLRLTAFKRLSLIATLLTILILSIFYGVLFSKLNHDFKMYNALQSSNYKCHSIESNHLELDKFVQLMNLNVNKKIKKSKISFDKLSNKVDSKILLFIDTQNSKLGRSLIEFLQSTKFKFDLELSTFKSLPQLISQNKGKYSLIIFENYDRYLQLSKSTYNLLNQYCLQFNVSLISFISKEDKSSKIHLLKRSSLLIKSNVQQIKHYHLNKNSKVLRIAKAGSVHQNLLTKKNWTLFYFNQTNYKPIALAYQSTDGSLVTPVVEDLGKLDGIKRILFGNDLNFWLHKLLLLDSISYLTNKKLSLPLERYLQIDIDDIFVGEKGTRLKVNDVDSLIEVQEKFKSFINNFRFNLGFSFKHLHKGNDDEDLGDDYLLKNVDKFKWFCHMYAHSQPHLYQNKSVLEIQMLLNKEFAQQYGIRIDNTYSVAPHHSGVYPIHEQLYDAWKKVYGIKVTSTEEYPHLRPARLRKGFIHSGIQVLPRQTCGLYTHTIFIDKYPGGKSKLDNSIFGGELFFTLLFNPINIFMTHMSNYANDRIALYTFESVFKFIRCWTNLQLKTVKPTELADHYFKLYPDEKIPKWTNPCNDKRHLNIWSSNKTCKNLPDFLILGPQKTGTTALHTFLTMHPSIKSNYPTEEYFEELQFFNGPNYLKGLDWYLSKFPTRSNRTIRIFEKSANYFDGDKVPERVHALLPKVKLIIILINPIKRAYSWYQHAKSHNDSAAIKNTFYDVITARNSSFKNLVKLRNRSLNPGCYSNYLERWLQYFDKEQLLILDGDELRTNPVSVMSDLQKKLNLKTPLDYNKHLRFSSKKGFYCPLANVDNSDDTVYNNRNNSDHNLNINSINSTKNVKSILDHQTNQFTNRKKQTINLIDSVNGSLLESAILMNNNSTDQINHTLNNDLDGNNTTNVQVKCLGKSKGRIYPEIDLRSINFLHNYYMKCNTMLFKLLVRLKIRIPSWLLEELS